MITNEYKALTISELCDRICEKKSTLIVYHVRSDADAVGSAFALRSILTDMGIPAYCGCADEIPERLVFMTEKYQGSALIDDIDLDPERVISVDSASPTQLGRAYDLMKGRIDLMIDHHGKGVVYADNYIDPRASATGEIIFSLAMRLIEDGRLSSLSDYAAGCLYAAISSDTGCFRFANVTPDTHRIAAELLEAGVDAADINHRLFESKSRKQIIAEGEGASRVNVYEDGRVAVVTFPYSLKEELALTDEHLETLIDIPRSIAGVEIAVSIRQPENKRSFRVSMRASCDFDVSLICAEFGGGGHKRAAGCSVEAYDTEDAEKKILGAIRKYLLIFKTGG